MNLNFFSHWSTWRSILIFTFIATSILFALAGDALDAIIIVGFAILLKLDSIQSKLSLDPTI